MSVSVRHVLHQGPMLGALGHTAYLALRQRMAGEGDGSHAAAPVTPGPEIHRRMQAPPRALIEDYVRFLGGDARAYRNEVPPHLFPQWCMPALAHTLDGLPYPVLRVLNGGCRVRVSAPLPQGERYEVRARLQGIDDDGRRAVLHQRVSCGPRSAPDALEVDLYAIVPLPREDDGRKNGDGKTVKDRARVAPGSREVARIALARDAGIAYAKLTGDFNPIHWLRPFARAAGFPSVILHGFGTLAFTWEALNRSVYAGDVHAIDTCDVKFARALTLPHEVGLYVADQQVFVGDAPGGPAYLTGSFAARGERMTDMILELSQKPFARSLFARAKLPIPLPEKLERLDGPSVERALEGETLLVAGGGELAEQLARTLTRAGGSPLVTSEALLAGFSGPGEAYGRHPKLAPATPADTSVHSIVFDATSVAAPNELRALYETYHAWLPALSHNGRSLILSRPPEAARDLNAASARAALDGFNRSLAKEIGARAATANLVYVEEGAEERLSAVLRFFLSKASAFVTAQPLVVSARARFDGADPWTQPLAGKVALVTGAARGIGEATARVLGAEGAHVVCLDRPEDDAALSTVARDVGGSLFLCDVLDAQAGARIAGYLSEQHRGVDIVVHNAGVTRDRTLARMSEQQWDSVLGINLDAIARINGALLEGAMNDGGRIISLSSIAGIAGNVGQTNYAASKAGVIGMTRFLAAQLAGRGITVNAVAPGFIETRMTAAVPLVVREVGRRLSALGQGGQPEDVARAIAFLASPGAAGVTGNILRVCGGALLGS